MNLVTIKTHQPIRYVLGRAVTPEGITLDLDALCPAEVADLDATQGITVEAANKKAAAATIAAANAAAAEAAALAAAEQAAADKAAAEALAALNAKSGAKKK